MRRKSVTRIPWRKVATEIRDAIAEHAFTDADSVTWHVLGQHKRIKGVDADFHTSCAFQAIRHEARQQLNTPQLDTTQSEFPGFNVQERYDIERGGRRQHVLTLEMTCQEMVDKALERRSSGLAQIREADELLRLARRKFGDQAVDECLGVATVAASVADRERESA